MAIGFPTYRLLCPFCFSLGHPWRICFLWASLTLLPTLHSHKLLLTSLGLPDPITLFLFLGFMGLPLTPYFLCLHYFGPTVAHSHFSISYTAHGYAIFLFPGFFKPIYLLKAHLFISWACDPLFLPLGPNGFATCLPTLCYPYCWAFFFLLGFSKMTLNTHQGFVLGVHNHSLIEMVNMFHKVHSTIVLGEYGLSEPSRKSSSLNFAYEM